MSAHPFRASSLLGCLARGKGRLLVAGVLAAGACVSSARATVITVQNISSGVSGTQLRTAERAIATEVKTRLARYWHVKPITFGHHGSVTVRLYRGNGPSGGSQHYPGGAIVGTGHRRSGFEVVGQGGRANPWTVVFSHEVLELLVDPRTSRFIDGRVVEVCDPVESSSFKIDGVRVSDFVTPRWFGRGSVGRFDQMGVLHRPFAVAPGGFVWG